MNTWFEMEEGRELNHVELLAVAVVLL